MSSVSHTGAQGAHAPLEMVAGPQPEEGNAASGPLLHSAWAKGAEQNSLK